MGGPIMALMVRRTGGGTADDGWVLDDPDGPLDALAVGPVLGALAATAGRKSGDGGTARVLISAHAFVGHCALLLLASEDGGQPRYRCEDPRAEGPVPAALLAPLGGPAPRLYCAAEAPAP